MSPTGVSVGSQGGFALKPKLAGAKQTSTKSGKDAPKPKK